MPDIPASTPSCRIAVCQLNPTLGDLDGNIAKALSFAKTAQGAGADVVFIPNGCMAGLPYESLAIEGHPRLGSMDAFQLLAQDFLQAGLGSLQVFLGDDNGDWPCLDCVEGVELLRIFEGRAELLDSMAVARQVGALFISANFRHHDYAHVLEQTAVLARNTSMPVVLAALVGGQDARIFEGGSLCLSAEGEVIAKAPLFEEALMLLETSGGQIRSCDSTPIADTPSPVARMYESCVLGLRDYVRKNNLGKVILGLSGGIDSALVAAMAADAIGGENIIGVSMPSPYSSQHSRDDAADTAKRLGLDYRVIELAPTFDGFKKAYVFSGLAEENLQARIRGTILMGISNAEGGLVLATGNKSECAVGYSTIYGDAVGGYAPLVDVLKTQVWELARWRNQEAIDNGHTQPIPSSSIDKPPSAELRPGQLDTDSLPDYELLDPVIEAYVTRNSSLRQMVKDGFDEELLRRVIALSLRSEWKRKQYPIGPKVCTGYSLAERDMPVTNAGQII
ncbi:MAG: NAD(+) synthase [Actinomycetaceae bacterium]|nr:NAD(+) synthase [Actinomycetaceae bacterium]